MSTQWTIGKKLFSGLAALTVLVMAASVEGLISMSFIKGRLDEIAGNTAKRIVLANEVRAQHLQVYMAQKNMIVNGFDNNAKRVMDWKAKIAEALPDLQKAIDELAGLMRVESGKKACANLKEGIDGWKKVHDEVEKLIFLGEFKEAQKVSLHQGRPLMDANEKLIATILANQEKFLKEDKEAADSSYGASKLTMIGLTLLSALICGVVVWVVRGINNTLRHTATEMMEGASRVASTQVSSSSQSLSQGATEQAASLEETSASMEEMAAMTRKNSENSQSAASMMAEMARQVEKSNQSLSEMVASMDAIKGSSEKVAKIIKTIDEIAFQTNILALNAAVEAARAGEAGMGFAVVADEVRNLAQRSAQAAKDTAALIEESISNSNAGSTKLEQVAVAIAGITENSTKVKALVDEVSEAAKQQAQGIDQVTQAVSQMEKVTQTTAANSEEGAAAAEEMGSQAETLRGLVDILRQMVGGHRSGQDLKPLGRKPRPAEKAKAHKPSGLPTVPLVKTGGKKELPVSAAELAIPLESADVDQGSYGSF